MGGKDLTIRDNEKQTSHNQQIWTFVFFVFFLSLKHAKNHWNDVAVTEHKAG